MHFSKFIIADTCFQEEFFLNSVLDSAEIIFLIKILTRHKISRVILEIGQK